ncbi:MAG: hypothetical protein PHQ26_01935 [Bacteroidales bacterium]|nr:hypothetical protein [Bacteroidales bacterium]
MLWLFAFTGVYAQNTNSPYSRFGYGLLETPALGMGKSMGGLGVGLRESQHINPLNPASYSAVDTMNMLFDFGVSASYSRMKEGDAVQQNPNGGLDYAAMKFALKRNWGVALGLIPYSKVGYSYSDEPDNSPNLTEYASYVGTGGLNSLFLGTAYQLGSNLSVGLNYSYIFGTITQSSYSTATMSEQSESVNPSTYTDYWFLNASNLELGVQYAQALGAKQRLVVGLTYSEKISINNELVSVEVAVDTQENHSTSAFELPRSLGVGVSWIYDEKLTVGMDYRLQNWGDAAFHGSRDSLSNASRFALGASYLPSVMANHYYQAIQYRAGLSFTDSYSTLADENLKQVALSLGLGLPLRNNRSMIHVSFEAGRNYIPSGSFISENFYKLSLDVTFSESWFFKRKL